MNFLAHLHLSYPDQAEMVGNFIGDYVKGSKFKDYPADISRGIQLHRKIDSFTDSHTLQRECKVLFREDFGLYAGIITDMLFDHLLAKNWNKYCEITLVEFTDYAYKSLYSFHSKLPERVQYFLPKMKAIDRLYSYKSIEGLTEAMQLMTKYTSLPDYTEKAITTIESNIDFLEHKFDDFYQELMKYVPEERSRF